ncbi:MAG: hypothetical protein EOM88_00790 [Clostridia bacterium]|nr:hypothetical protein [Clostridia bacterium]
MINQENVPETKNHSIAKNFSLYLKVHIMPTLNKPLCGKAWHWIVPVVVAGFLIVLSVYLFGN